MDDGVKGVSGTGEADDGEAGDVGVMVPGGDEVGEAITGPGAVAMEPEGDELGTAMTVPGAVAPAVEHAAAPIAASHSPNSTRLRRALPLESARFGARFPRRESGRLRRVPSDAGEHPAQIIEIQTG